MDKEERKREYEGERERKIKLRDEKVKERRKDSNKATRNVLLVTRYLVEEESSVSGGLEKLRS